ncbi:MAG: BMP family ABC transporter substrate-binding protein [Rhodospirillaceae bacterium]|nr:BMP family ABC transporter substrate-binding protein [Rhodospirillaceae bacterium]
MLWLGVLGLGEAGAQAAEPLKVGFVYVGPIGDYGYSHQHNEGRLAVQKHFGDKVKTTYVENVPEGADAERVIRELAVSGHDLIFATSFWLMNATVKVAKQFPNVKFEHATGYLRRPNLATYMARFYETRYVAGVAAGRLTKSNKLGFVSPFPIPEMVRSINAFALGVRSVNPKAVVHVIWTNSWYDPGKEREAAEALIAQGADVIAQHTDSAAPMQAAEEHKVWGIGQASDMVRFGPHAQLTSFMEVWSGYYIDRVQKVLDGTWVPGDTWKGFDAGMVALAPFNPAIPPAVKAEALKVEAAIRDGRFQIFTGPVRDQAGRTRIEAGRILSDQDLLEMNWLAEGVVGVLPK